MRTIEPPAPVSKSSACETHCNFDEVSSFNRRGLFVGGCPKSGTTLLLSLLDSHPELVVLTVESHFLEDGRKYRSMGNFQTKVRHLVGRPELRQLDQTRFGPMREPGAIGSDDGRKFDHRRFARLAEDFVNRPWMNDSLLLSETIRASAITAGHNWRDCVRWVKKTPSNVPYADDLFRLFPEAKLIQLVRDPRAVFASRQRILTDRYGSHAKAHRLVREWNESSRQIQRLRERTDKYLIIRYEDLVRNSRAVMEEVCQFAGIRFLPTVLEPTFAGGQWQGNSAFFTALNGIDTHPVDQWKNELTQDEIWWVDLHCREGMRIAGYQPMTDAKFSFNRWAKRLPGESWKGYLRARKSSLCQMAGVLKDCRYDLAPEIFPAEIPVKARSAPSSI